VVREFVVRAGCEREFAQVYGRDGLWDRLLRLGRNGYQGCELIDRGTRRFELWDYWTSHLEFEAFRDQNQCAVQSFQVWLDGAGLIEREEVLGMFYQNDRDSDSDGETGLVPA
jgi:hypothetical protein